jgi:2-methylcitrate dehydratase PrpD
MGGHPSAPVLAAALAVGEELESSGEDLLTAFIIGFEVETKLSRVTNPLLYDRGWHPTSVLSVFGATAAVCKLLRLDMGQATQAISSAASMCAGIKGNFATLTKSLHVGRAAQAAVQAGYLAKLGNTANVDIFETQMGFLDLYCSAKPTDWKLSAMEGTLGNPWEIITPGITVKPYPCGGSTHSTIDGHLALRKEHPIALSDIKEIKSGVHARRWPHTNRPAIRSGLEGKFSNQYVTALSWMFGAVELKHFTDEVALDPALQSLLTKIDFYKDPEISSTSEETHANVQVTLNDGTVLTKKVTRRKGSPSNPLTLQDLQQKFVGCTSLIRPTAWVSEALSKLSHL